MPRIHDRPGDEVYARKRGPSSIPLEEVMHFIFEVHVRPGYSAEQYAEAWVEACPDAERLLKPSRTYRIAEVDKLDGAVHFFGDNVAFDKEAWLKAGR